MAKEEEASKKLSRKDFVKGAAVVAGAGALASCAPAATPAPAETPASCPTCPPAEACAPCPTPWLPEKWDKEADVVVVGYGAAGACAAAEASDAGAEVLLLEKMPKGLEGGNSCASTAAMSDPYDKALATDHLYALNLGDTPNPVTSRELCASFIDTIDGAYDWYESIGGEWEPIESMIHDASYFFVTGEPGKQSRVAGTQSPHPSGLDYRRPIGKGVQAFKVLSDLVESKDIEVMYETKAAALIQDPGTKEILGIRATNAAGEEICLKAKKGVVMTLGSFENSPDLCTWFLNPGIRVYTAGGPANTGDGIYMVQQVGAVLWHMNCAGLLGVGVVVPARLLTQPIEWDCPISVSTGNEGTYIVVNKYGKRFTNVATRIIYTKVPSLTGLSDYSYFDGQPLDPTAKCEYTNIPPYMIFDETYRLRGPITRSMTDYAWIKGLYTWSDDNSAEIENGLITKADTVSDLATKLGIDPAGLEETVAKYNAYCAQGEDPEFGRPAAILQPLETPPFYGAELCLVNANVGGGPKRNGDAQVVDKDDNPIPRLYAAGEFGGIQGAMFHGTLCMVEAVMVGRLAGRNAAAEEPWD
jgi:succinate dehydrogenase/fumarate reductase flavoprotein subunit